MAKKRVKKADRKKEHYRIPEFWEKVEHYNAKLIPLALLILLIIIVLEILGYFYESIHHFVENYHTIMVSADYIIIAIFIVDLIFLAIKAKTIKFFFKSYWLDIIAVIPLVLLFTVLSRVWRVVSAAGQVTIGQAILHESLEARKGVSALTRSQKFAKYIRMGARSIRVITKSHLFSKFQHHNRKTRHPKHLHDRKKYKVIKKSKKENILR